MKGLFVILLILSGGYLNGQSLHSLDVKELSQLLDFRSDTTYVINFWATWCSPCVKELPYFEELHRKDHGVKVVLVNLDFPNQVEKRVIPFILEHDLTAEVMNMTEVDYSKWIPLVHEDWSGAIPATLIFNDQKEIFIESEISREELFYQISKFKQQKSYQP